METQRGLVVEDRGSVVEDRGSDCQKVSQMTNHSIWKDTVGHRNRSSSGYRKQLGQRLWRRLWLRWPGPNWVALALHGQ